MPYVKLVKDLLNMIANPVIMNKIDTYNKNFINVYVKRIIRNQIV